MKRLNLIKAMVIFGFLVFAGTELLSLLHWLSFWGVAAYWLTVIFVLLSSTNIRNAFLPGPLNMDRLTKTEILILSATGLIITLLGITAIVAPPNNFDSMTYHMGRIPHWIQNRSVDFYVTNITRQLWAGPMAEYIILHFQILSGSDYFANLVQWFAMAGSCVGGSLLAGYCGASRKGQIFTAFLVATIPMGIMQSTTTQNDYAVGFWLLSLFIFLYKLKLDQKTEYAVLSGICLGLGILTKGTMLIYGGTLMLWFFISSWKRVNLKWLLLIGSVALMINAPHFYRNYQLGGHILTPAEASKELKNQEFNPKSVLSLLVRNIGLHLNTPFKAVNKTIEKSVYKFHDLMGMETNDLSTTLGWEFRIFKGIDEDAIGNFFHLLFFVCAVLIFLIRKTYLQNRELRGLLIFIMLSFLAVCVSLKWQIWGSRLHLPLFVIGAPVTATVLEGYVKKGLLVVLTFLLFSSSIPLLTKNPKKRLVSSKKTTVFNAGREKLYFITEGDLYPVYKAVSRVINATGCKEIGLSIGEDHWEYPWWILLQVRQGGKRIEHAGVDNHSKMFEKPDFEPCVILKKESAAVNHFDYEGVPFENILFLDGFSVYNKTSSATNFK